MEGEQKPKISCILLAFLLVPLLEEMATCRKLEFSLNTNAESEFECVVRTHVVRASKTFYRLSMRLLVWQMLKLNSLKRQVKCTPRKYQS